MKKAMGLRSTTWWLQNSHRNVEYSIGNRVNHIVVTKQVVQPAAAYVQPRMAVNAAQHRIIDLLKPL